MIITNKMALPQAFVKLAEQEDYKCAPNEYRVTSLLKGIREAILEKRHDEEIEQDVSDMIWLLFGKAVHSILEQQEEEEDELKEERLKIEIGNHIVSGKPDLYSEGKAIVTDYKTASIWKVIYEDYDDWRKQTLIYAYMLRKHGFPADKGQIIALLKDHKKSEAKRNKDYPQLPVKKITFKFTEKDFEHIEQWLHNRVREIAEAEKLPDDELPLCTNEERYNDGDKFAVMKKGRKKALRVLDTYEQAQEWIANNKGDFIETRPGDDKKCIDYCSVCYFCDYYQSLIKKGGVA